jgi:hypothetical protein
MEVPMPLDEAEEKAYQAIAMGLIKDDQFEAYVKYLLEKHKKS